VALTGAGVAALSTLTALTALDLSGCCRQGPSHAPGSWQNQPRSVWPCVLEALALCLSTAWRALVEVDLSASSCRGPGHAECWTLDEVGDALGSLASLRMLSLRGHVCFGEHLRALPAMVALETLDVSGCDGDLSHLVDALAGTGGHALRTLRLRGSQCSAVPAPGTDSEPVEGGDGDIAWDLALVLPHLSCLQTLDLAWRSMHGDSGRALGAALAAATALRDLTLGGWSARCAATLFAALARSNSAAAPQLTSLQLSHCALEVDEVENLCAALPRLRNLRHLCLSGNELDSFDGVLALAAAVRSLPWLEEFAIDDDILEEFDHSTIVAMLQPDGRATRLVLDSTSGNEGEG
jgi:hypothetical protein